MDRRKVGPPESLADDCRRRGIFELLADVALLIRPDSELCIAFIFNLSHSAMQSTKYSRRND